MSRNIIYCLIPIRKCYIGEDYLQNNYDIIRQFDTKEEAIVFLKTKKCCTLLGFDKQICEDILDIRGNIINERGEIYGYLDDNQEVHYIALVDMPDTRRNSFLKNEGND